MNIEILGIGIAVTFAIIALSAVILYLGFRIKETFREEKSLKIQFAKTFFLIGILFLAGGVFYFFAQAIVPQKLPNDNASKIIESGAYAKNGSVYLGVSYPANIRTDDNYTISFMTNNPSTKVIHNAAIKLVGLSLLEAKSNFKIVSDSLDLGDISPGETNGYLLLKAPSKPVILEGALIFQSKDTDTVAQSVKINVLETVLLPTPTHTPNSSSSGSTGMPWYNIIWPSAPASSISIPTSSTPAPNSTSTPALTPGPTATPASNSTSTPTPTLTPDPTATPAPNSTSTPTPTLTPDPTATPAPNSTSTPTPTLTPDPTATPAPEFDVYHPRPP